MMNGKIGILLRPRIRSARNTSIGSKEKGWYFRILLLGTVGLSVWGGAFLISLKVLGYFQGIEELGDILAYKLLSMMFLIFFSLLIFSGILACLSRLYLARDLFLVHSAPAPGYKIFISRWIESTFDSSWMVVLYSLPVLVAYGAVYRTGLFFFGVSAAAMVCLSVICSCISALFVMIAVVVIPANRVRTIFVFLGLSLFLVLYVAFRLLRPERLVDPEVFVTALVYLKAMDTQASPYLPSTWVYDAVRAALSGLKAEAVFHVCLAASFGAFLFFVNVLFARAFYFMGFSKAQTAPARLFGKARSGRSFLGFLPPRFRALAQKEVRTFFRDQTQWTQILLIAALVVIYIYNFKVLPLDRAPIKTVYLQNLLAFLNMGLAAFVLTAVTARFAFSAVSTEKEAFWLVKAAPIDMKTYLWLKFAVYFVPLVILTQILIVATNIMLQVAPFMMALSVATIFLISPAVVAMGIGLGAAYPDFKSENPAQAVTSYGGLLFMLISAAYICCVIVLEAGPVYKIFMAGLRDTKITPLEWLWVFGAFMAVAIITAIGVYMPMRLGVRRLSRDW